MKMNTQEALEYADGTRGPRYGDGDERAGSEYIEALRSLAQEVLNLRAELRELKGSPCEKCAQWSMEAGALVALLGAALEVLTGEHSDPETFAKVVNKIREVVS